MEPSRPADPHEPHHPGKGTARRTAVVTFALVIAGLAPPALAQSARPGPRIDALRQRADQLGNQLEQLTEQYNGLKVRLEQAQRAAVVAGQTSVRAAKALKVIQRKVGRFAAMRYMNGANDGANDGSPTLLAASDPRALLDRAATLHYFTQQDDTQIRQLTQAIQNAQWTCQDARDRAAQAAVLRSRLVRQRATIRAALEKVRKPLLQDAVERAGRGEKVPPIPGGPGKAVGAVRAALSQVGVPYVWGGAVPGRGFDCSGLTMWAYRQVGVNLPHYGGDQWNAGVHVSRDQLEPGDLIFFYSDIHHMGMYIGDGKFVHAPHTGDRVRVADLSTRPFAGAVRVA
ncbi:NlpC/P60 family protein [Actinoallomurus purpureus]|uniref:NlpC/P60 family protein n=1 Tax=Actinoallomurus purpureus TaxID=478114 RepID=UPI00209200F1|nr:NlpC/P60 family protein [Actinoallomurus purpureus]MCO6005005.1 NlpC/P60 family protein [Actinoallomurus purpureus]